MTLSRRVIRAMVVDTIKMFVFFTAYLILEWFFDPPPHVWDSFDVAVLTFLILIYIERKTDPE
jgi:hypothetical protein